MPEIATGIPVRRVNPDGTPLGALGPPQAGQVKLTGVAQVLGASAQLANGLTLRARSTNAGAVWVGNGPTLTNTDDGTGNGYKLLAGESVTIAVGYAAQIYIIGTNNDVVYWIGN